MIEALRAAVPPVARRHGLTLVVLHGSEATGRTHEESDVDLAVRSAGGPLPLRTLSTLVADLGEVLGGVEVEIVDLARADPLLLKKVFEAAIPLFDAGGAFAAERLRAFHRYEDYRPFLRLERDAVRRALGLPALDAGRS